MRIKAIFFAILVTVSSLHGQIPSASFSVPSSVCLNEPLTVLNASTAATEYVWDFCHDDLKATPTAQLQTTLPTSGTFFYHSIRYILDAGEWVAFATDMNGNRLYRLDYGTSLSNVPTVTNLGTLSGFSSPSATDVIKHNGIWYAFVLNLFGNSVVRIEFGNGIKQAPTLSQNLGNISGLFNTPSGIKLVFVGGKYQALIVNLGSNTVNVLDFDSSPANAPTVVNTVGSASFNNIYGISLLRVGNSWYGLLGSFTAPKTYLLNFGSSLSNSPMVTEIDGIPSGATLELANEGTRQYAIVRSRTDGIYRIDFGDSFGIVPIVTRLGQLGQLLNEARNVALVRDSPGWKAFTVEASTGRLIQIDFEGDCNAQMSLNSSIDQNPSGLFYKIDGNYFIDLTAKSIQGENATTTSITVPNLSSSGVIINKSLEQCVGSQISFHAVSSATLISFDWDFDDGSTASSSGNVNHAYSTNGDYLVSLEVTEQNGCKSSATKTISIFNTPAADFLMPAISGAVCTQQAYTFNNQTSAEPNAPVTWQWAVDNVSISNSENFVQSFGTINTYSIGLTAAIPGCSSVITKNFTVTGSGNAVDFSFAAQCFGDATIFNNNSSGTPAGYLWDFDDGQTSNAVSPVHQFSTTGAFDVTLQATNGSGCTNSKTETVVITSAPTPDFFIDLPPFSCTGTPTQFHDATPPPPDGNIVSWNWNFDDASSTSTQQNPQHTYALPGTYLVTLQVETNFGCQSTTQIPIDIAESVTADFSVGPECLQKGTQFQSLVLDNVLSWRWSIGNSFYSFPDPSHTFSLPGNYSATLIVVGANGCEALATKNITINPAPLLDFSNSAACADAETLFIDMTTGVDIPANWSWRLNGQESAMGSPASITFESSGISPVQMLVTTAAGCEYALTKNVVVAPSPTASFTASSTFGAPPMLVQFSNTSVNASSYTWDFGIGNATSTEISPNFSFNALGDYLVELTASNGAGCSDTFSQTINVLVPLYSLTLENLLISESLTSSAKTLVVTIKNNSNVFVAGTDVWVTGSNGLRLKSYVDLNLLPNAFTEVEVPIQIFSNEDFLCVELDLLGDANLSDNSSCQNLTDKPVLMTPYPNPTSGTLWFDVVLSEPEVGTLKIADSMGKTVFSQQFSELSSGMNRIQIDFGNQSPGAYFAIWEVNGKTSTFRFLTQ